MPGATFPVCMGAAGYGWAGYDCAGYGCPEYAVVVVVTVAPPCCTGYTVNIIISSIYKRLPNQIHLNLYTEQEYM